MFFISFKNITILIAPNQYSITSPLHTPIFLHRINSIIHQLNNSILHQFFKDLKGLGKPLRSLPPPLHYSSTPVFHQFINSIIQFFTTPFLPLPQYNNIINQTRFPEKHGKGNKHIAFPRVRAAQRLSVNNLNIIDTAGRFIFN